MNAIEKVANALPNSKDGVIAKTGLSETTVKKVLRQLQDQGQVKALPKYLPCAKGQFATLYYFAPSKPKVVMHELFIMYNKELQQNVRR